MDVPGIQPVESRMKRPGPWKTRRRSRGKTTTLCVVILALVGSIPLVAEAQPAPVQRLTSARSLAEDQLRRAVAFERRGDVALAIGAYTAAIRVDPTLGAAYLGLARLRERLNDRREAELLYTHATMLRDVRARALFGRALLRRADARGREAFLDLEESVALEADPAALQTLAGWYVESRNWPAALAVWRRLARLHSDAGDRPNLREAELSVAALRVLAAEADPVQTVPDGAGWVRRSLARIAKESRALGAGAEASATSR